MNKAALVGAAAAAGLLAFAGQADAAVYTATYTGQVGNVLTEGTYANFFAGSDVASGTAFKAVFRWDEADADPSSVDSPPDFSIYSGALTATLTVGASTFAFAADDGLLGQADGDNSAIIHGLTADYAPNLRYALQLYVNGGAGLVSSWDWRTTRTYDLTGAAVDGGVAFVEFSDDPAACCSVVGSAAAYLTATSLTVAREGDVAAVPEPDAWALMILGFGGAGAMLRTRRRGAAAA